MKGAADHLARVTLELGGKSPNIVFEDADLDAAANGVVAGIFAATGQTCMAGSRLFVQDSSTMSSSSASPRGRARSGLAIRWTPRPRWARSRSRVTCSTSWARSPPLRPKGRGWSPVEARPDGPGFFVEPTIFGDVSNGMGIARDEVFGPVLAALRFADEDEAIALANATEFGLAAGVWTRDVQRAHRMARALRAGTVWVNAYRAVGPMAPFGGYKSSGMGRENGLQAVAEYTELKTVWIELTGATRDPFQLG